MIQKIKKFCRQHEDLIRTILFVILVLLPLAGFALIRFWVQSFFWRVVLSMVLCGILIHMIGGPGCIGTILSALYGVAATLVWYDQLRQILQPLIQSWLNGLFG